MNKLFEKIVARTVLEVLWEKKAAMMSGELINAVQLKLGRQPSKDRNYLAGDVNHAIQILVNQGKVEARRLGEERVGCMQPAMPVITWAYCLPVLDQLAAFAPEA